MSTLPSWSKHETSFRPSKKKVKTSYAFDISCSLGDVFCFSVLNFGNILLFEACNSWPHILLLLLTKPRTQLINVVDKIEINAGNP